MGDRVLVRRIFGLSGQEPAGEIAPGPVARDVLGEHGDQRRQIADRLGITRAAIYAALLETPDQPAWMPPADKRIMADDDGTWTFFCPSHEPGRPVIVDFTAVRFGS
jgi:hypothetical protein